jgi:hypothetical protein
MWKLQTTPTHPKRGKMGSGKWEVEFPTDTPRPDPEIGKREADFPADTHPPTAESGKREADFPANTHPPTAGKSAACGVLSAAIPCVRSACVRDLPLLFGLRGIFGEWGRGCGACRLSPRLTIRASGHPITALVSRVSSQEFDLMDTPSPLFAFCVPFRQFHPLDTTLGHNTRRNTTRTHPPHQRIENDV